jgi:hypothetical protein
MKKHRWGFVGNYNAYRHRKNPMRFLLAVKFWIEEMKQ